MESKEFHVSSKENKKNDEFPVDNLIRELNNFIKSCDERKEYVSTQLKKLSNVKIKENIPSEELDVLRSCRNKRKSGTPVKIPKKRDKNAEHWRYGCNSESGAAVPKKVNEDAYEPPALTIDESGLHKKKDVMVDVPPEVMDLIVKSGIDDKLEDIAMRERLTGTHVKNIIKQVITDKSVLAMLKSGVDGTVIDDASLLADFEPKLTRARKRELDGRWNEGSENCIGPTNNFSSVSEFHSFNFETSSNLYSSNAEMLTLGSTEFLDEEDDDEYHPELDTEAMSDEESVTSSFGSPSMRSIRSLSSQCSSASKTPVPLRTLDFVSPSWVVTPRREVISPRRHLVRKGLQFSRKESLICNRTRSKYSLNDTPLEYLELAFQPPDITADMYETNLVDGEYKKFLLEFVQPQNTRATEDDEQMDPEYNLIADAEEEDPTPEELKEEMRGDRAVKISRREMNDLLNDVLNSDAEEIDGDGHLSAVSRAQMESGLASDDPVANSNDNGRVNESYDKWALEEELSYEKVEDTVHKMHFVFEYSAEQLEVLECQLAQHVQLLTQSILMTSYEDTLSKIEQGCKSMLKDMYFIGLQNCEHSNMFKVMNIEAAVNTVQHYDFRRKDYLHYRRLKAEKDVENRGVGVISKIYPRSFPPIIQRIFALSSALLFLELLPKGAFPLSDTRSRKGYLTSEYYLLACSFKEVVSDVKIFNLESRKKNAKYFDNNLTEICDKVALNTCVITTGKFLADHLSRLLKQNLLEGRHDENPLIKFTKTGIAELPKSNPPLDVMRRCQRPLKDVDPWTLPSHFQKMVKRFRMAQKVSSLSKEAEAGGILVIQNQCETKIILPSSSSAKVIAG